MRCTVVWTPFARNQLAQIWLDAVDRKAVENAANRADVELQNDAEHKGQDFGGPYRLLSLPPLQLLFTVKTDDQLVEVVAVKRR